MLLLLIAEQPIVAKKLNSDTILMHLDKSHISAHSYPETDDSSNLSTFRVDIDVATCGTISPLKALGFLIENFDSDVVIMDYKVRGFTRDIKGIKHYIDHDIESITNFIDKDILAHYKTIDMNIYQENIYHTKMILEDFHLNDYLFEKEEKIIDKAIRKKIESGIKKEMEEIFRSRNL